MGALNQIVSRATGGGRRGRAAGGRPGGAVGGRPAAGRRPAGGNPKDEAIGRGVRSLLRRFR
jgi:hypothetical protein